MSAIDKAVFALGTLSFDIDQNFFRRGTLDKIALFFVMRAHEAPAEKIRFLCQRSAVVRAHYQPIFDHSHALIHIDAGSTALPHDRALTGAAVVVRHAQTGVASADLHAQTDAAAVDPHPQTGAASADLHAQIGAASADPRAHTGVAAADLGAPTVSDLRHANDLPVSDLIHARARPGANFADPHALTVAASADPRARTDADAAGLHAPPVSDLTRAGDLLILDLVHAHAQTGADAADRSRAGVHILYLFAVAPIRAAAPTAFVSDHLRAPADRPRAEIHDLAARVHAIGAHHEHRLRAPVLKQALTWRSLWRYTVS